jgi:hypothetical protein
MFYKEQKFETLTFLEKFGYVIVTWSKGSFHICNNYKQKLTKIKKIVQFFGENTQNYFSTVKFTSY